MVKSDLTFPSVSHRGLAEMARGWFYADLAVPPMDLASAFFKHIKDPEVQKRAVQEQMELARENLQEIPT